MRHRATTLLKRLMWVWTELILLARVSLGRVRGARRRSRREAREMRGSNSQWGSARRGLESARGMESARGLVVVGTWLDRH